VVGNRDREERRDKEEEGSKRELGSWFQVVETLIGGETSEEYKNTGVEWGDTLEGLAQ
jgi:hypothetical protein